MRFGRTHSANGIVWLLLLLAAAPISAQSAPPPGPWPAWLPRYEVNMDLDVAAHRVHVRMRATWTNPQQHPTGQLVFNAHSRFVVPRADIGLTAKTLELLRLAPSDAMGIKEPALVIHRLAVVEASGAESPVEIHYEGDTKTTLSVPLAHPVGFGESVTVLLDLTMHLPPKQGRWGQWQGITTLSNWLPVFAYYGPPRERKSKTQQVAQVIATASAPFAGPPHLLTTLSGSTWQPTSFVPWHQPFFNEAAHYRVRATLPADQQIACSGNILACRALPDGRQQVDIVALGVRDFAFLCSARYNVYDGFVTVARERAPNETLPAPRPVPDGDTLPAPRPLTPAPSPPTPLPPSGGEGGETQKIHIRVLAFPEHEFYARQMVRIAQEALTAYSKWFGPYPWPEFTIAEAFFGWNGNECSTLVMIDERIFNMPHLAGPFVDSLVSHEICHQWWYNLVGTNGYCETWMDEGLATYFSHRLLDQKVGRNNNMMQFPRALAWLPNIPRDTYRSYGLYGSIGRGDNGPVVRPMPEFGHVANLFSMTYDKGSRIVGLIEDRLGSAAFLDFMRGVFHRYRYRILRVADFQHELEVYTGRSWNDFFESWLYGPGLTDWCIEKVHVQAPPKCAKENTATQVVVLLQQKADINEQTTLGIALPNHAGYPIRIPIIPQTRPYDWDDPPAHIEPLGANRVRIDLTLPAEPTQITVDPDQLLVDKNPANNFWKSPIRYRVTPVYTFLEESDLTTAYDRWNVIAGPWIYGTAYYDAWYTRTTATMIGFRAGLYRTQSFAGGAYAGYRTDYRDVVVGVDGLFDHWPSSHFQVGFDIEQRLYEFYAAQQTARRGVLFGRYIFKYGSSLYYPPMEFLESFVTYQDNFLPFDANPTLQGVRFNRTTTGGFHYRKDYLTPYWNPEGGFRLDLWYEGGMANEPSTVAMQKMSSQFSFVQTLPDLSAPVAGAPWLANPLHWLSYSRLALRAYGGTSEPNRGEFYSMGGSMYFRGFDLAQRQGSTLWVASAEWRLPVARNLHLDACDHVFGLRNIDIVPFYDVGNIYTYGHSVGPIAHAVGTSFRFDVSWFSLVERTLLRVDIAKALNVSSGMQLWFGVGVPF